MYGGLLIVSRGRVTVGGGIRFLGEYFPGSAVRIGGEMGCGRDERNKGKKQRQSWLLWFPTSVNFSDLGHLPIADTIPASLAVFCCRTDGKWDSPPFSNGKVT